ncbi:MAG: Transcriptional regulator, TetR family [Labilithrix sp.]|jgi:AcrR family transcriptional regulator|nr:Transcriptional regulator, TetR family [Labilithrix sp.]
MSADETRPLGNAGVLEEPSYAAGRMAAARQVRGWRVVEKVLEATLEELSLKGYAALSIEDVATRAGVAKTTIYRRWPAKADLALQALRHLANDIVIVADTGTLRGDLIAMLRTFRGFASSTRGQSLMRMMVGEGLSSDVARLVKKIRNTKESEPREVVTRAITRGELPRGTDPRLVLDVLFGAVQHYIFFMQTRCTDQQIEQLVDLVLLGAANGGARPRSTVR